MSRKKKHEVGDIFGCWSDEVDPPIFVIGWISDIEERTLGTFYHIQWADRPDKGWQFADEETITHAKRILATYKKNPNYEDHKKIFRKKFGKITK